MLTVLLNPDCENWAPAVVGLPTKTPPLAILKDPYCKATQRGCNINAYR